MEAAALLCLMTFHKGEGAPPRVLAPTSGQRCETTSVCGNTRGFPMTDSICGPNRADNVLCLFKPARRAEHLPQWSTVFKNSLKIKDGSRIGVWRPRDISVFQ